MYIALFSILSAGIAQTYLSPADLDFSPERKSIYITATSGKQLLVFDMPSKKVTSSIPLPGEPTGTVFSNHGKTLFVTGGGHEGRIWKVENDAVVGEFKTGHTPTAPVLSPDGKTLYVCNQFDNDVSFINLKTGVTEARVATVREPNAADITPDGNTLFIANLIPAGRADGNYIASAITAINTQTRKSSSIPLINGAEGVRGIKVSPDGNYVFATHRVARYLVPTSQLERGWVSTDALSIIRVKDHKLIYTVLLDDIDQGFTNPWAIDFSNDGKTMIISSAGNHEISLIDYPAMMKKVAANVSDSNEMESSSLSFLSGIRKRIKLEGNGPRSLVVDGDLIFIAHYYSDSLEVIRMMKDGNTRSSSFALNSKQPMTQERLGEIYFNDAALCFQNWLSCATCHPDARTDGLNWDLLNDGIGNPKNAKSMLLAHKTPRAMWLGVRDDAYVGVRAGIQHIQFAVRPPEDAEAIDAYLKSLEPIPSPYLENGELSRAAQRGRAIFESIGCVRCHPSPLFTDLQMYDIGTTTGSDEGLPVDVPQLIEVWRTAPYMHDGRAATMLEVFNIHKHGNRHGGIDGLSPEQLDDLVEYVLSL
ncbi:hypothetical protein P4C99_00040 [Pontiellaceae bacterium B1224]|nr:hypothetical protein [Pontiellaceae bacterium B1224]